MFRNILCLFFLISCNNNKVKTPPIIVDSPVKKIETISLNDTPDIHDSVAINLESQAIVLRPIKVQLANSDSFTLNIPAGYKLSPLWIVSVTN